MVVVTPPLPPAPAATASYSVTVLPMRTGGAPLGIIVLDDVDPASHMFDLRRRIVRLVRGDTPARVYVFLYRVDLTLGAFPDRADWSFLSALPLSQLFHRVGYPAPLQIPYDLTIRAYFVDTPDLFAATRPQPLRVIHFIAEIVEMPRVDGYPLPLPSRYNCHRRLLADVDADAFAQLQRFLSSPPEPASDSRTSASPPFCLAHVPCIAQLTLPEGKLFARQGFDTLLDDILEGMANEKPFVYITATAGAGKTAFLWYVLHTLCRRGRSSCGQWFVPPMDIVVDVPGWFGLIDTAGQVFTGPRRKCFRVELVKKETLYLVDLGQGDRHELPRTRERYDVFGERPTYGSDCKFEAESRDDDCWGNGQDGSCQDDSLSATVGNASQLVVGLPRHSVKLRAAFENYTAVRFLPPWREDELELCRRECFPALNASLLVARVELWGCLPRRTLAPDPAEGVGEQQLNEWVGNVDWLAHIMSVVVEKYINTERDGSIPPMRDDATQVLELLPPLPEDVKAHELTIPPAWRFVWGSRRVRDAVFSHLFELQKRDDAWKLPDVLHHRSLEYMYETGWNEWEVAQAFLPFVYPSSLTMRMKFKKSSQQ